MLLQFPNTFVNKYLDAGGGVLAFALVQHHMTFARLFYATWPARPWAGAAFPLDVLYWGFRARQQER